MEIKVIYKEFIENNRIYLIGNNGEIIRKSYYITKNDVTTLINQRKLKGRISKCGYHLVELQGKSYLVHRLVAMCFIPKQDHKNFVNHKDGNKLNNNVDNLEWCTHKENIQHSYKLGLHYNDFGEKARNFKYKFKCVEYEEWGELTALEMANKINENITKVNSLSSCAKNITYRLSCYKLTFTKNERENK